MTARRIRPGHLLVTVVATNDERGTTALIDFLRQAPNDSPLGLVRVHPEHSKRFPKPMVTLRPGSPPEWDIDFLVPDTTEPPSMVAELKTVLGKNGWQVIRDVWSEQR